MAIEFTDSAGRHGYTVEDAIYAMQHAEFVKPEFQQSRMPGRVRPTLWVGPSGDALNPLLEVMAEVVPPDVVRIFHVMPLREHVAKEFE